jgi:flagellar hook-associated protein 2
MGISLNAATLLSGNGIDVTSLVNQVQSQQSGQLTVWQQEQTDLQTQATALGTLNTDLTNLQTAMNALTDPLGALTAVTANSSMPAILTATADTTASPADHTIVVNSLASAGTVYTNAVSGGADVSILPSGATGGDLTLQVGGSSGVTHDIQITAGSNDTVTKLASYINQQSATNNWGISASVLSDATGARLAIYSQATGTAGALAITGNTTTGSLSTASMGSADTSILSSGQATGTIQLQMGGTSGTTATLAITQGSNDTLNTLASYITNQSTQNGWGITANVVKDSNGYHLAISSKAAGSAGALAFTSNDTTLTPVANPATSLNFVAPTGGADATLTIDGIPFSSTSNTVTGALPGVTLNLVSAEPSVPLQLAVGSDATQASTAINAFVVAYNTLISAINDQFTVDPSTNAEGPLGSDGSLRSLQSSLLSDASYSPGGSSGVVNLRSLGISTNDDGTLTVDNTTLNSKLTADPAAVINFFQNSSTGFAQNFGADLTNLTSSVDGVLNLDLAQNSTQQGDLTNQINNFKDQLANQKTLLIAEFSQVNAALESYPYLLAELNAAMGNPYTTSSANTTPTSGSSTSSTTSSSSTG